MPIKIEPTSISEVKIIKYVRFSDERGFFCEIYKDSDFLEAGIPKFVQDNLSQSSRGVIRGLHWQVAPFGQGKLVSCIKGSILDVAVDLRADSSTYGHHISVELTEFEPMSLWIPEGFAHGFQALEDNTRVSYKVTNYWNKEAERAVRYDDPNLRIQWHDIPVKVSEKDLQAPNLREL
jgi:dTDP-4-dehydrorhamnose 3,5-epimerase